MGKYVYVRAHVFVFVLTLVLLCTYFDDFHTNSVKCSSCQSKQAKIIEIGAFHENAHAHTYARFYMHKLHLTRKAWQSKNKNNDFSIVHFDYNCHETFSDRLTQCFEPWQWHCRQSQIEKHNRMFSKLKKKLHRMHCQSTGTWN